MEDIFQPINYTGFVVVGYAKMGILRLQASGSGTIEELLPALKDDEVC